MRRMRRGVSLAAVAGALVLLAGCSTARDVLGLPNPGDPSSLKSAESRWLLIRNARFGDVPSEPEYIWVEEDKVPPTLGTLLRGEKSVYATPEIVGKYGPPPGGGKISPRQGVAFNTGADAGAADAQARAVRQAALRTPGGTPPTGVAPGAPATPALPAVPETKRGWVVYVDTTRIVVDLTPGDGMRSGTVLSVRRDRIPIVHPVTGEVLGELDEEVATVKVTETREKFSVAEIESVATGSEIKVKDRVIIR
jgi:hypothetical protein